MGKERREKNLENICKMFTTDCKKLSFITGVKEKPFLHLMFILVKILMGM